MDRNSGKSKSYPIYLGLLTSTLEEGSDSKHGYLRGWLEFAMAKEGQLLEFGEGIQLVKGQLEQLGEPGEDQLEQAVAEFCLFVLCAGLVDPSLQVVEDLPLLQQNLFKVIRG
jgi:hypothetical protein